jgi:hypothetical protein
MTGNLESQDWDAFPPGTAPQRPTGTASGVPGPAPYGSPGYGPPHGSAAPPPGYGLPPYGPPPGYARPPYGPPSGYGYAYPLGPPAWPAGPRRPGVATAAAVLGFVTGGLTTLFSFGFLIAVVAGEGDAPTMMLLLGFPCAAGVITGAVRLLGGHSPAVLFGSAVASVLALALAWLAAAMTIDRSGGLAGLTVFLFFAMVLPVLTAIFSWLPTVRGWAADGPA